MNELSIKKLKEAIIAHLLEEKEASYQNMMAIQKAEVEATEKNSAEGGSQAQSSGTGEVLERVEARSSVVEALQNDINILSGLDSIQPTPEIQLGDVVETDKGNFFVAVPADEFEIAGVKYRGISVDSPLFQALLGKKNGDTAIVNNNRFTLQNSY
jgi:transcription elongation GreA/GreB family factor